MKKCLYENCQKPIEGRPNKKFCNNNCRSYYYIYLNRQNKAFKKGKEEINAILNQFKDIDKDVLELFNKIYK